MLKRLTFVLLLILLGAARTHAQTDIYGGLTAFSCTNSTSGNGWQFSFVGTRQSACDPLGHPFIAQLVDIVSTGKTGTIYTAAVLAKYGCAAASAACDVIQLRRFQQWGFGGTGVQSDLNTSPITASFKLPQLYGPSGGASPQYAEACLWSYCPTGQPTKDLVKGTGPKWNTAYGAYHGANLMDYFDPGYQTWLAGYITNQGLASSVNSAYIIGLILEDNDYVWGTGAGPDFTSIPAGHQSTNLGWTVFLTSPVQSMNYGTVAPVPYEDKFYLYSNTTVASKAFNGGTPNCNTSPCSFGDFAKFTYGTTTAMNTAFSLGGAATSYTSFGSSGTPITGESVGTGNGSTVTFAHTTAHLSPSPNSIQIFVNGVLTAGDCYVFSGNCSGTAGTSIVASEQNVPAVSTTDFLSWIYIDSLGGAGGAGYRQQITTAPSNNTCLTTGSFPSWNTTIGGTTTWGTCVFTNVGPSISAASFCNLTTGACTVTFNVAPPNTATITMNYVQNGWCAGGTGLADECGNGPGVGTNGVCAIVSTSPYTPCTAGNVANMNPGMGAFIDFYVTQFTTQLLKSQLTQIRANINSYIPYCGMSTFGTWGVPPHANILKAASAEIPCLETSVWVQPSSTGGTTPVSAVEGAAIKTYMEANYSGALFNSNGNNQSSADSYLYGYLQGAASIGLTDQVSRGKFFANSWNYLLGTADTSGKFRWVGYDWFPSYDFNSASEIDNLGFTDSLDNPYDGVHDCVGSSTETINGTGYTAGSEFSFSGNILPGWTATTGVFAQKTFAGGGGTSNTAGTEILVNVSGTLYMFLAQSNSTTGSVAPTWTGCTTLGTTCADNGGAWLNVGIKTSTTCWGNMIGQVQTSNAIWPTLFMAPPTITGVQVSGGNSVSGGNVAR